MKTTEIFNHYNQILKNNLISKKNEKVTLDTFFFTDPNKEEFNQPLNKLKNEKPTIKKIRNRNQKSNGTFKLLFFKFKHQEN